MSKDAPPPRQTHTTSRRSRTLIDTTCGTCNSYGTMRCTCCNKYMCEECEQQSSRSRSRESLPYVVRLSLCAEHRAARRAHRRRVRAVRRARLLLVLRANTAAVQVRRLRVHVRRLRVMRTHMYMHTCHVYCVCVCFSSRLPCQPGGGAVVGLPPCADLAAAHGSTPTTRDKTTRTASCTASSTRPADTRAD